jgi:hypothetical protein
MRKPEVSFSQTLERIAEINQAALRRLLQYSDRSRHMEATA